MVMKVLYAAMLRRAKAEKSNCHSLRRLQKPIDLWFAVLIIARKRERK